MGRKQAVNVMMFVWLPVSTGWHYGYDTVLMHRDIQDDSPYIPERFGVHGELYVEVTITWCFTAKDLNGPHHHAHQVWRSWKKSLTVHLQGMKQCPGFEPAFTEYVCMWVCKLRNCLLSSVWRQRIIGEDGSGMQQSKIGSWVQPDVILPSGKRTPV